ncbi:phage antirepressor KilAC domain-containing protein, partial [Psychrobacter sp.]|uniref:phage antirepressor KilAC domain-containing protein n=1 Tax=Psychrobacter sp. TaxID=56811 RepID=UPI002FDAE338
RHDHVLRDIRAYAGAVIQMERGINVRSMDWNDNEGVQLLGDTPVEGVTFGLEVNPQNKQSYPVCHLDKNTTLIIVSGYNVLLRKRIIERWQELEQQVSANNPVVPALPNFTDPYEAAIAWAEQYKAKEIAQEQLALAAPKVSHYDNVVSRKGLLTATQVGQKIGLSAVKLNKILDELKVYNQAVKRSRVFNSWFIQQGLGELKQTPEGHSQALFSLKGEAWVIERLTSEGAF